MVRETIAESIQVGNPASLGWRAVTALRESGGTAVAASDAEIIEAQALTATRAGIFAEPAAKKLRAAGTIGPGDVVVCNLTGHGLKQPEAIRLSEEELTPITPTLESLREQIQRGQEQGSHMR